MSLITISVRLVVSERLNASEGKYPRARGNALRRMVLLMATPILPILDEVIVDFGADKENNIKNYIWVIPPSHSKNMLALVKIGIL